MPIKVKNIPSPETAWTNFEKEKEKPKGYNLFNSYYDIFKNFTECTTIQCLAYIFFNYQTSFGKIFWGLVMVSMASLGAAWIAMTFMDWQNNPVLTTITTTAYPVEQIQFPAVTICSQGTSWHLFNAGFWKLFLDYLTKRKEAIDVTPYDAATVITASETENLTDYENIKYNLLKDKLSSPLWTEFMNESFPGIDDYTDAIYLMMLINSKNAENDLAAIVAMEMGNHPCKNSSSNVKQSKPPAEPTCSDDFVLDGASGYCYKVLPEMTDILSAKVSCDNYDANLLQFESDDQVTGFLSLLNAGELVLPPISNGYFFIDAQRDSKMRFSFGSKPINMQFKKLSIVSDDQQQYCLAAKFVKSTQVLELVQTDCHGINASICRKPKNVVNLCDDPAMLEQNNILDIFLDPSLQMLKNKAVAKKSKYYRDLFLKLNQTQAFQSIFSVLWYGSLPCSDLIGVSAKVEGEKAILKYCEWKGEPISCAAIFKAFPTDTGMCCSFNMKSAEEIFMGKTYPDIITKLQNQDKNLTFKDRNPPRNYTINNEPKTSPGRNRGLLIMLDAHTNIFTSVSSDRDYKGFTGLVSPKGIFPYTGLEGFDIVPGHNNLIALSGIKIDGDSSLRALDVTARKCLFPDENAMMKLHKNYSFTNCMFECGIVFARENLRHNLKLNYTCSPWFFPNAELNITVCDPREAKEYFKLMSNMPENTCKYCLPDCSTTIYDTSITSVPFQSCESFNFGVSPQCNVDNKNMPQPRKFADKIVEAYSNRDPPPQFLANYESNIRSYRTDIGLFSTSSKPYNAYDEDIAVVQIYFKKSSFIQLGAQPKMTWIDFFASVGGLLGLVLGMGIVSFIELFWLCLRLGARKMKLTNWVQ